MSIEGMNYIYISSFIKNWACIKTFTNNCIILYYRKI